MWSDGSVGIPGRGGGAGRWAERQVEAPLKARVSVQVLKYQQTTKVKETFNLKSAGTKQPRLWSETESAARSRPSRAEESLRRPGGGALH